jgi:hypothetical protein
LCAPVPMSKDIGIDDVGCDRSHAVLRVPGIPGSRTVGFTTKSKQRDLRA